ncbi:MAG TPA: hypothetical protein VFQ36_15245 [Ktedonobacteraceae bacterium]|nr:hypothetical protein [Ktedonobacteraceae bacterium]
MFSQKNHFVGWQSLCLILLTILLAACSTGASSPASPSPTAQKTVPATIPTSPTPDITGPTAPGLKNCQPESPLDYSSVGPEMQGTGIHAELWALIQSTSGIPPVANTLVKIVWRMTGRGYFSIVASGPSGMKVSPSQGPDGHMGSNWNRPGDEWGSVFTFPIAGCWDLHATRDNASGDVWLKVVVR